MGIAIIQQKHFFSKSQVSTNIKRLKLQKKKKGISKLEKSVDAWNLLQDTNMTENFELSSDEGASTVRLPFIRYLLDI